METVNSITHKFFGETYRHTQGLVIWSMERPSLYYEVIQGLGQLVNPERWPDGPH